MATDFSCSNIKTAQAKLVTPLTEDAGYQALFDEPATNWRRIQGRQPMSWYRKIKAVTSGLAVVHHARLPGWKPQDAINMQLNTLEVMVANRTPLVECLGELDIREAFDQFAKIW